MIHVGMPENTPVMHVKRLVDTIELMKTERKSEEGVERFGPYTWIGEYENRIMMRGKKRYKEELSSI